MILPRRSIVQPRWPIAALCALWSAGAAADSPARLRPQDFPGPVFQLKEGLAAIEAESAARPAGWELRKDAADPGGCSRSVMDAAPTRYAGQGYLRWTGPSRTCQSQGKPEVKEEGPHKHGDLTHGCQGPAKDWLVFKVWADSPGDYEVDIRSYHLREDGDNDVWIGHFGQTSLVLRQTNCRTKTYSWGNYTRTVQLKKGLNAVYLSGRSHGYGVDRVAIFKADAAARARDPATPEAARR